MLFDPINHILTPIKAKISNIYLLKGESFNDLTDIYMCIYRSLTFYQENQFVA